MPDEYIRRDFALAGTELYKYGEMEIEAVSAEHIQRLPAADVVPVVRGKPVVKVRPVTITEYHEEIGRFAADGSTLYRKNMVHAEIPYKHCPVCGATLCSRWYNYCGKCGAKMDGGADERTPV